MHATKSHTGPLKPAVKQDDNQKDVPTISQTPFCELRLDSTVFEVLGKDTSQSLICNISDTAIMTIWQYRVMGCSAL